MKPPRKKDTVARQRVKSSVALRPSRPANIGVNSNEVLPGAPIVDQELANIVDAIRMAHRFRRYAMKVQQKLDRSLESLFRVNATEWSPDASDADREKANREVKTLIKRIRDGDDPAHPFARMVAMTDEARRPADQLRDEYEKQMERLAKSLPVYPWLESVRGAGALGLATIVAEAEGDNPERYPGVGLSRYAKPDKLWKRLGYAPYDGHAGSTWKRMTWRPRTLTSEEWTANPFSGERYALMSQIAIWLKNAQWIGKAKTESGEGEPNGPYGEIYAKRRAATAIAHPDWTKQHSHVDAIRVMMKAFLKDLWTEWKRVAALGDANERKAAE